MPSGYVNKLQSKQLRHLHQFLNLSTRHWVHRQFLLCLRPPPKYKLKTHKLYQVRKSITVAKNLCAVPNSSEDQITYYLFVFKK